MSAQGSLHVHVVDDEPVIAWTLAAILESHGYKVLSFTSPFKSLEAAADTAPHILITDVSMPGMNGVELAIRIKKVCPTVKSCCSRDRRQQLTCWLPRATALIS